MAARPMSTNSHEPGIDAAWLATVSVAGGGGGVFVVPSTAPDDAGVGVASAGFGVASGGADEAPDGDGEAPDGDAEAPDGDADGELPAQATLTDPAVVVTGSALP